MWLRRLFVSLNPPAVAGSFAPGAIPRCYSLNTMNSKSNLTVSQISQLNGLTFFLQITGAEAPSKETVQNPKDSTESSALSKDSTTGTERRPAAEHETMADQSRADSEGGGYKEERMDGADSKGERKDGKFEGQNKGRVGDRGSEIARDGGGGGAGHGDGGGGGGRGGVRDDGGGGHKGGGPPGKGSGGQQYKGGGKGRGDERRTSDEAHDGQRRSGGPEGQQKGGLRKWFRGNLSGGRGGGGYNLQRQYSQEPPKGLLVGSLKLSILNTEF